MDKILRLTKEIEKLKKQKQEAEDFIKQAEKRCQQNYKNIANAYKEFFDNKTNREFILYNRFPSVEALDLYVCRNDKFPLHDVGSLNVKELAEIIKHIYQFKTGKEYSILTIGVTERDSDSVYGGQSFSTRPHLFFMIGNEKTLSPFQQFNGKFINEDKLHTHIYLYAKGKDLINIELNRVWCEEPLLDIECLTHHSFDKTGMINYYDLEYRRYDSFNVSPYKNVFSSNIRGNLRSYSNKTKGIKDVLDFDINHMDTYIAKILISIIIYKRNNNIIELTEDDYNHIFDVLFGEKVNITSSIADDFPRRLTYVPNKKIENN